MEKIEDKIEQIQFLLEHLELKLHRKIMEKANEQELPLAHSNRN